MFIDWRTGGLGAKPHESQVILARARMLGATSPESARLRAELNPHGAKGWDALLTLGQLLRAENGRYYLANSAFAATSSIRTVLPIGPLILLVLLVVLVKLLFL